MVNFVKKRLQVFVSSTYTDLIAERQAAVEAILVAGHIPAGMELFSSGDESQMEVINQWIDESDVYLLILGGRYGSVDSKSGKSYTQLEYEYAISKNKPMFACVLTAGSVEERVKKHGSSVIETSEPQKLKVFRELVLSKVSKFCSDEKDIKIAVGQKLSELSRRDDLIGWVKSIDQPDLARLADEMARLSQDNAAFRERELSGSNSNSSIELSYEEIKLLADLRQLTSFFLENKTQFSRGFVPVNDDVHRKVFELLDLGLVAKTVHSSGQYSDRYELTRSGRVFAQRIELETARAQAITDSIVNPVYLDIK
jgi:nucleoside 2-deoxyribosyltransferase